MLRKQPPGKLLSSAAHRIDREYRVIRALNDTDIPVPKVYHLCEDENKIGTPFYLMEFLDGRIFQDAHIPGVSSEERNVMYVGLWTRFSLFPLIVPPACQTQSRDQSGSETPFLTLRRWKEAVQILARLHRIEPSMIGLGGFGKASGFYTRQNRTLKGLDESYSKVVDVGSNEPVGKIPGMDEMLAYFGDEQCQPQDRGSIIHGDYKIDNLVFHKTKPEIIGILE